MRKKQQQLAQDIATLKQAEATWNTEAYLIAKNRVAKLSTFSLMSWADNAILGVGMAMDDLKKASDAGRREDAIAEMVRAVAMFQAVAEELQFRNGINI